MRKIKDLHLNMLCEFISWITTRGLKRVALQFPDSLLSQAPAVAQRINVSYILLNCILIMTGLVLIHVNP